MRKHWIGTVAGAALVALLAVACGGTTSTTGDGTGGGAQDKAATVAIEQSKVGDILTDTEGRTLYVFTPDKASRSVCYGECEDAWPPLTVEGQPVAGTGIQTGQLGITERKDGTRQVTFNDRPLYYFSGDQRAGDVNGQGLGGVWYLFSPSGKIVKAGAPTLGVTESDLGQILADPSGMTLYAFVPDKRNESVCYGECEKAWPPLTVKGQPVAGEGIQGAGLGITERKDGSPQVTYMGMPLYYFAGDKEAGDVKGQGLNDVWYVVSAQGKMIRK